MAQCIKDSEHECIGLAHTKILEQKINQLEEQQKRNYDENRVAHKEFYTRLEFGEKAQAVTQNQLAQILADTSETKGMLGDLSTKINDILQKPAKHWDAAIGAGIVVVVGFILKSIGIF